MTRFPIIALVGHSGSGKTTPVETVLAALPDECFRSMYPTGALTRHTPAGPSDYY